MLFDLKGKRRRVIQGTYLALAVLMGGGLVLFGIGGEVQGGLLDAFTGEGSNTQGNPIVEERLKKAEARLKANPNDQQALEDVTRSRFQLAGNDVNPDTGLYGPKARPNLEKAAEAWQRYLATNPDPPDASLARVMLQVYGEFGLNRPKEAAQAAEIVAQDDPSSSTYVALARYAAMAGDKRTADLAGKRALALAPKSQKKVVKKQVGAIEKATAQGGGAGGAPGVSVPGGAGPGGG
jgi:tetratricopeptide (TPR) repeat protein